MSNRSAYEFFFNLVEVEGVDYDAALEQTAQEFLLTGGQVAELADQYGDFVEAEQDWDDYDMTDVEADADVLRMAGYGTDEDYGYYGGFDEDWG